MRDRGVAIILGGVIGSCSTLLGIIASGNGPGRWNQRWCAAKFSAAHTWG